MKRFLDIASRLTSSHQQQPPPKNKLVLFDQSTETKSTTNSCVNNFIVSGDCLFRLQKSEDFLLFVIFFSIYIEYLKCVDKKRFKRCCLWGLGVYFMGTF